MGARAGTFPMARADNKGSARLGILRYQSCAKKTNSLVRFRMHIMPMGMG